MTRTIMERVYELIGTAFRFCAGQPVHEQTAEQSAHGGQQQHAPAKLSDLGAAQMGESPDEVIDAQAQPFVQSGGRHAR